MIGKCTRIFGFFEGDLNCLFFLPVFMPCFHDMYYISHLYFSRLVHPNIMKLEPDMNGHLLCPYCFRILTPIVREWIPAITDYICHWCQIGFKVSREESIDRYIYTK